MKKLIFLLFAVTSLASAQIISGGGGSGGGSGTVTTVGATGNAVVTATVTNPTTTPLVVLTLPNSPANTVLSNSSSSAGPASYVTAPAVSAANLTSFPLGQFANAGTVNAVTSGLNFEYHFQEASGATTIVDYSGAGNAGTVTGTVGLTGTLVGGMNVCSTGCVGNVAPSGYVSLPATINTDPTLQFYTCTNQLTSAGITGGFIDMVFGGLISATVPSSGTTQATGLMLAGAQGNSLSTNAASISKYAIAPGTFNNATVTAQSIDSAGGCHLITVVRNTAPTPDILYVDGKAASGYQITGTGTLQQAIIGVLAIGTPPYATLSATYKHPYPIYYAAGFNRALTAEEVQRSYGSIQSWMGFRGVVQLPPVYSDAGNQIVAGIDSLTWGFNSASVHGWPFYLSVNSGQPVTTTPYTIVTNIATVGYQLKQAIAECQSGRWQTALNPNSPTTIVLDGGTNDLNGTATAAAGLPAVSAAVTYQRMRRLVQCSKGLTPQPRVFVVTMISRGGNSTGNGSVTNDSLKNTYDNLLRQDYAGADGLIDIASFAAFGADGAFNNSLTTACNGAAVCYTGDTVHLTDGGQQTKAGFISSYLNYADAKQNIGNPTVITAATYQSTAGDVAIAANPTLAQTITLPTAVGLTGTERYIYNAQNVVAVSIAPISGETINGSSTPVVCAANTRCTFVSVLGTNPGIANASVTAGAHWESK